MVVFRVVHSISCMGATISSHVVLSMYDICDKNSHIYVLALYARVDGPRPRIGYRSCRIG